MKSDHGNPMTRTEVAAALEPLGELGRALLATHDYWRARCHISNKDIERAGLTVKHITAWLTARGWVPTGESRRDGCGHRFIIWRPEPDDSRDVCVLEPQSTDWFRQPLLRDTVASISYHLDSPRAPLKPIDLLEQMVAKDST